MKSTCIGITGHRPNRLVAGRLDALQRQIGATLEHFQAEGYDTVVSSLAEGADRMVAKAALGNGMRLVCPLPFASEVFVRDFADDRSVAEFYALVARASAVVVLPGNRSDEGAAYAAASAWMLGRIGCLLAIWDGGGSMGPGGTRHTIEQALLSAMSVVWLHATRDQAPKRLAAVHPEIRSTCFPDGGSDTLTS